jgi:hypothetical protein
VRKEIEEKLRKSVPTFVTKVDSIKETTTWQIEGQRNPVGPYSKSGIANNAVRKQLDEKPAKIIADLLEHYEEMDKIIPTCSSPRGFKEAWDVRSNGQDVTKYDLEEITALGGQAQLENRDTSEKVKQKVLTRKKIWKRDPAGGTGESVFSIAGPGATYFGSGKNGKFIKFLRHNPNQFYTYEDDMNEQYVFKYQPPAGYAALSGALRYRWMEELSNILELELVVLIVLWFNQDVNDTINNILFVAPAKIVRKERSDFNKSLFEPLKLEIISQNQFYEFLDNLNSIGADVVGEIKRRSPLDAKTSRAWSYDKLQSSKLGNSVKNWARKTGRRCPQCDRKFDEFSNNKKIAFGHIISQDWANSFTFLKKIVHHPDNLYLSCGNCNATLSNRFPDFIQWPKKSYQKTLRDKIEEYSSHKGGTIGDWIRDYADDIKQTKP